MNRPITTARLARSGRRVIAGDTDYVAVYRFDNCGHERTEVYNNPPPATRKLFCYECSNSELEAV